MKRASICILLLCFTHLLRAQDISRPKLVVGIVVDQMRPDYIYRFYKRFGKGGFRRLMTAGFNCENTFINYSPAHTAAGHSCIYTGSVPALNGIVGNNWYDKALRKIVYCTDDPTVSSVGSNSVAGKMSPIHLWSTTIGDELRMATNFESKTISIALKDRASILPGGHSANAAYWFDNASGGWITSSYYRKDLPEWMTQLNARKLPDEYLTKPWNTLYPVSTYTRSSSDSNSFETRLPGEDFIFPHRNDTVKANRYEVFRYLPSADTYTVETAEAAINGEQLGLRGVTDFLAVSFSPPDYIGHTFGPNSVELEDAYLRLDKDLEAFLSFLDRTIGKGEYLLFLTADHAAAQNPGFLKEHHLPADVFDATTSRKLLNDSLTARFKVSNLILQTINYQIFLNDSLIRANGLDRDQVKLEIQRQLLRNEAIVNVVDLEDITRAVIPQKLKTIFLNGYNRKFSGALQVIYKPQTFEGWRLGTTHGQWNPYDTHIPLFWFGWKVKPGRSAREIQMTDIAPTLASFLHIQMPSACIGQAIEEVIPK